MPTLSLFCKEFRSGQCFDKNNNICNYNYFYCYLNKIKIIYIIILLYIKVKEVLYFL